MGLVPSSRINRYISSGLSVFALFAVCAVSGEIYSVIADDGSFKTAKPQQTDTKEATKVSDKTPAKEESATTKQTSEQSSQSVINQTQGNSSTSNASDVSDETETSESSDFHATAYCLKGRTASGEYVRKGIIAADPKVLPLGTVVHIKAGKYTGTYKVADTGGRIRGNKVDIYMPTYKEAIRFGRQKVKIRVINRPSRNNKTTKKAPSAKGR